MRISFTDATGTLQRVRGIPDFYVNNFVGMNIARRVSSSEVLFYRGYLLRLDKIAKTFAVYALAPPTDELCRYLRKNGLHWEAHHLAGRVSRNVSLAPYQDASDCVDRHLLFAGFLK